MPRLGVVGDESKTRSRGPKKKNRHRGDPDTSLRRSLVFGLWSGADDAQDDSYRHAESRSTQPRFDRRPALRLLSWTGAGGCTYRHAAKHLPSDLDGRTSGFFNATRVGSPAECEWRSSADPHDL